MAFVTFAKMFIDFVVFTNYVRREGCAGSARCRLWWRWKCGETQDFARGAESAIFCSFVKSAKKCEAFVQSAGACAWHPYPTGCGLCDLMRPCRCSFRAGVAFAVRAGSHCNRCVVACLALSLSAFAVMGAFFARVARLPFVGVFTRPLCLPRVPERFWAVARCSPFIPCAVGHPLGLFRREPHTIRGEGCAPISPVTARSRTPPL